MKPKGRTAVVTLAIGRKANSIAALTHPLMSAYASKIGSDFVVINRRAKNRRHAKFEKFQIYDLLLNYNRILYLDIDILVMPECPNIFELVPRRKFGAFFDSEVTGNKADIPEWRTEEIEDFQCRYGNIDWHSTYFNTGVMVVSKPHRHIFDYNKPLHKGKRFVDQTQINYNFQKAKAPAFDVGPKFNYLLALSGSKEQFARRFDNYILHYAGFEYFYKSRSLHRRIAKDLALIRSGDYLLSRTTPARK